MAGADVTVTPCGDGSYCCGNGTLAEKCCNDKKGVFVVDGGNPDVNPSSTSKAASSTSAVSKSTSSSSSSSSSKISPALISSPTNTIIASPSTTSSSSNHAGAIAGGVVGGLAIIALLIFGILLLRRRRVEDSARTHPSGFWGEKSQVVHEAPPNDTRNELDGRDVRELQGGTVHHEMQ